jgi:hypothetical protein
VATGEVELVDEVPDLMTPEVLKQISGVNDLINAMNDMTDGELLDKIKECAALASEHFPFGASRAGGPGAY